MWFPSCAKCTVSCPPQPVLVAFSRRLEICWIGSMGLSTSKILPSVLSILFWVYFPFPHSSSQSLALYTPSLMCLLCAFSKYLVFRIKQNRVNEINSRMPGLIYFKLFDIVSLSFIFSFVLFRLSPGVPLHVFLFRELSPLSFPFYLSMFWV